MFFEMEQIFLILVLHFIACECFDAGSQIRNSTDMENVHVKPVVLEIIALMCCWFLFDKF